MNFVDRYLWERSSALQFQDLLKVVSLHIHEVLVVVASQNLERLKHVLYIVLLDSSRTGYLLYRKVSSIVVAKQELKDAIKPIAHICPMAKVTQWLLGRAFFTFEF